MACGPCLFVFNFRSNTGRDFQLDSANQVRQSSQRAGSRQAIHRQPRLRTHTAVQSLQMTNQGLSVHSPVPDEGVIAQQRRCGQGRDPLAAQLISVCQDIDQAHRDHFRWRRTLRDIEQVLIPLNEAAGLGALEYRTGIVHKPEPRAQPGRSRHWPSPANAHRGDVVSQYQMSPRMKRRGCRRLSHARSAQKRYESPFPLPRSRSRATATSPVGAEERPSFSRSAPLEVPPDPPPARDPQ